MTASRFLYRVNDGPKRGRLVYDISAFSSETADAIVNSYGDSPSEFSVREHPLPECEVDELRNSDMGVVVRRSPVEE